MDDNEKRILNWKRKLIEIFRRQFDNAEREGFSFLSYDCIGNKLGPVLPSDLINFLEVLKRLEDEQCIAINENQMLCEAFLIMNNEKADKAFRHLSVKKRDFKKELKEHGERHISSYRESLYKIGKYIQNLEEVGIEHLEHIFREEWNDNIKSVIQFLHHLHFSKIIAPQDNTVLFNGLRRISPIDINVVNSFLFPADKEIFRSLHDDVDDPTHNRKISIQTQDNESENESLSGETELSEKGACGANDPGVFDPEKLLHSSDDEKSMIPDLDKLTGGEDPAEEKGEKLEELPEEKSEKSKEGDFYHKDGFYPVSKGSRGYCLIINIQDFEQLPQRKSVANQQKSEENQQDSGENSPVDDEIDYYRKGSEIDREKLKSLFGKLKFITEVKNNLKAEQILDTCRDFAMKGHKKYDMFVLAILTHGGKDVIYGTDWKPVNLEHITNLFSGLISKDLRGKPKFFIIQACQGKNPHPIVNLQEDSVDEAEFIPNCADMVWAYSTMPGFKSFRSPDYGSWFISYLHENITLYHDKEHLLEILTRVNRQVSELSYKILGTKYSQMPCFRYTGRYNIKL